MAFLRDRFLRNWGGLPWLLLLVAAWGCDDDGSESSGSDPSSPWPAYTLERTVGSSGTSPGRLRVPMGVDVDAEGNVYVADTGNRRVQVLSPDGSHLRSVGAGWVRPMDVEVTTDGRVWVADFGSDLLRCFQPDGQPCARSEVEIRTPAGITTRERGGPLVAEFYGHRVASAFGSPQVSVGGEGGGAGQLHYPTDAAWLEDGGFVVADAYNHRVQRYDDRGRAVDAWTGPPNHSFRVPSGVAVADGVVHVADGGRRRVVALDLSDGRVLAEWSMEGDGHYELHTPVRVTARGDRVYLVDAANDRILVLKRGSVPE